MFLIENPMPLIFFAVAIEAVLGVILYVTGRGAYLIAMIGVLLLMLGGVALEWAIVTEREKVEAVIYEVRDSLEAEQWDTVLSHCSPKNTKSRNAVHLARSYVTNFDRIKITKLEIDDINELTSPPTTVAHFWTVITAEGREFGRATHPIVFHVTFRLEQGRWVIADHELDNAPPPF